MYVYVLVCYIYMYMFVGMYFVHVFSPYTVSICVCGYVYESQGFKLDVLSLHLHRHTDGSVRLWHCNSGEFIIFIDCNCRKVCAIFYRTLSTGHLP